MLLMSREYWIYVQPKLVFMPQYAFPISLFRECRVIPGTIRLLQLTCIQSTKGAENGATHMKKLKFLKQINANQFTPNLLLFIFDNRQV